MAAERIPFTTKQKRCAGALNIAQSERASKVTIPGTAPPSQEEERRDSLGEDVSTLSELAVKGENDTPIDEINDFLRNITIGSASIEDDWVLVDPQSDGDESGESPINLEPTKPSEAHTPTTLTSLPVELRLEIFSHILTSTETTHPIDITRLATPQALPSRDHLTPKSYSYLLTSSATHRDLVVDIAKSHPLIFYNAPDLTAWLRHMEHARHVILDLGDVHPKVMHDALYCMRNLPKLEVIEVRCTPRNREAVRIPPGWKGFPSLRKAIVTDPKMEAECNRAHVENQGLLKTALQKIAALRHERSTLTPESPRVKDKITRLVPAIRPNARDQAHQHDLRKRRIGVIMVHAMYDIGEELKKARWERVRLETEFPRRECEERALSVEGWGYGGLERILLEQQSAASDEAPIARHALEILLADGVHMDVSIPTVLRETKPANPTPGATTWPLD
ncbi:hypothetical protein PRZ48_005954 [Zasmidium cellare]|uniref:F-box domain-containing protein n=1 Tax=Zasmidium cellare TaxID=395010 RepID=A0ABR0EMD8_ZASCE|nr:hypothetical protein PRZ48_005954 [Zasmidium cellare]